MVSTLTKPGDSILTVNPSNGGYDGLGNRGYPSFVNVKNLFFPYDSKRMNIDVEEAKTLIEDEKPALVVFGQSYFLFPHPVKELSHVCGAAGSQVAFDGSHVLGLIGGGRFQRPLNEGADLMLGSTHKSFFGPQGGMILGTSHVKELVKERQFPGLVDNAHWNRMAALIWALDEIRRRGAKYASQVIANARALAKALHEGGLPVKCADYGFTESHQVFLDINGEENVNRFSEKLEEANIIVDHGIRLGTNESTRRGMKARDMERIAELIIRVYKGEEPSSVRRAATRLRKEFETLEYT
jgi:glycine hydroxymethyltransferase